jgi:ribonucleotide reductase alpha subunit
MWESGIDYPEWMTEESLKTLQRQHLLEGETPNQMYIRIVETLGRRLKYMLEDSNKYSDEQIALQLNSITTKWLKYLTDGWLCPSTPILSNTGTKRGFPISCFVSRVPDSIDGIYDKVHEMALLTKMGGGVGITFDKVRGRGETISGGGFTEGIIPFIKVYDAAVVATSQSSIRRGAISINLPIRHKDIKEFLKIRLPIGDVNRQSLNVNHCVTIDDFFYESLLSGDELSRNIWAELLSSRMKTGQPYIFNYHNVNNNRPDDFKKRNLKIDGTNLCCLAGDTEIITKDGIFKIKDLVGKTVTIFDGENWVECNNFTNYGQDEIYRITLKNGSTIDCNSGHRHFIAKNYNAIRKNRYYEKQTTDLSIGEYLQTADYFYNGNIHEYGAYLKGFLLGDGTKHNKSVYLNVHSTKYMCCDQLIKSAKEISQRNDIKTNTITEISFSDEKNNKHYDGVFGKSEFKQMRGLNSLSTDIMYYVTEYRYNFPLNAFNWDYESKLKFLSGIFDSDGTYNKTGGLAISNVNYNFILNLQKFVKTIGCDSNIDMLFSKYENRKIIYRLTINSIDSFDLFEKLCCQRLKLPSNIRPNRKTTGWRKIINIEKLNATDEVFCPTIPTTGKFLLANGVLTGNSEILLPHDPTHTVVCDLASVNLAKWDEWKDDIEFIELSLAFLDVNLQEFIVNAKSAIGFEHAVRFAEKSRALGLGVLGWHTLLQTKSIPFNSISARGLINKIGSKFHSEGQLYNKKMGLILGNPEWCDENRNSTLFAVAPTTTNSLVSGGVSQGIEPIICNSWVQKSAKGTFVRKNKQFQKLIEDKYPEHNTDEFWDSIMTKYKGSIQHVSFLTEHEKEVFLTSYEINQLELVKNAAVWQKYIDQGISLNLFFPADVDPKWLNKVHLTAWEEGVKTLYYVRTESILSREMGSSTFSDCLYCQ